MASLDHHSNFQLGLPVACTDGNSSGQDTDVSYRRRIVKTPTVSALYPLCPRRNRVMTNTSEELFQAHPEICCEDQISSDPTESPSGSSISTDYRLSKPRALTISSASTTTHVDRTYKGRSPCGRYHRARILHDTLRSSLPPPPRPAAPDSESSSESYYGLGLRRIFSSSKKEKDPRSTLKPLLLPGRLGLNRTRSYSAPNPNVEAKSEESKPDHRRRLSLAGWLPVVMSTAQPDSPAATSPPAQSARLKPLVLPQRSSDSSSPPTSTENMNMLAWLLDCIQRDVNLPLHWSVGAVQEIPKMLLQDGQAKCLVVRAKRRSALF